MRGSEQGEKKKQKEKAMQETIQSFMDYLQTEKKASKNTELSYQRDLQKLVFFLKEHGIEKPEQVNATVLNSYLLYLEREQFSPATISRSIAAIHMFCQYACREGKMTSDPSKTLQPPKVERKMPEILSIAEVDLLLRQPKTDTPKGIRDKAMLEMLYATGIRVSELIHLKIQDVNLMMGYITCRDEQERIVPFGGPAKKALEQYLGICHGKRIRLLMCDINDVRLVVVHCLLTGMALHAGLNAVLFTLQGLGKLPSPLFLAVQAKLAHNRQVPAAAMVPAVFCLRFF